jgi:multisubunit Na+/H+ antiporter MnhG subunit
MKAYLVEVIFAIIASILSVLYILFPNPHLMAIFVFIVQPMFAYAIISTGITILKDLKRNRIL